MSANVACQHRTVCCSCVCDCCPILPAPSAAALLLPAIRRHLFRYGSVRTVASADDPWTKNIVVSYTLVTGESADVRVPWQLWRDEKYSEILALVTKDLGVLPT